MDYTLLGVEGFRGSPGPPDPMAPAFSDVWLPGQDLLTPSIRRDSHALSGPCGTEGRDPVVPTCSPGQLACYGMAATVATKILAVLRGKKLRHEGTKELCQDHAISLNQSETVLS